MPGNESETGSQKDQSAESGRLAEDRDNVAPWKKWGPYLSERQWGTVREDYSADGNAWNYFTHDQARSRAYKWGEDGIGGISDDRQQLCWALALWNGKDPILKERIFGLANSEGNHGEDVKEYYYYIDSTPTHSYMKYLYKYPQSAYPYDDLVQTNAHRTKHDLEYELVDTGIFSEKKYFDVFVEYAKAGPEDILIRIEIVNRGPDEATVHVLPHLWFRNTWWKNPGSDPHLLHAVQGEDGPVQTILAEHPTLGTYEYFVEGADALLFTNNETNNERVFGTESVTPYVKDAINQYVVHGKADAVSPGLTGSKAASHHVVTVPAGASRVVRLRLREKRNGGAATGAFADFDQILADRRADADQFWGTTIPARASEDEARVMRQALSSMLWTKQYYDFDLDLWLHEHGANPLDRGSHASRNSDWYHMVNDHIISMPDKWEYPWYAAWDLAFHTISLSIVDMEFALEQLQLMLSDSYLHPNGQIPAYEWNFGDVNPPVHAFALLFNSMMDPTLVSKHRRFVRSAFNRLLLNFNWWVNRKDPRGRNAFNGGFLGLDNIGVFDRSSPLPTGGFLEQADGTAWMAFYSQNMLELAAQLADQEEDYAEFFVKFTQHFLLIAGNMDRVGNQDDELWDEEDGFFFDVLILPDGRATRIKVYSMVGLLPLAATAVFSGHVLDKYPDVEVQINEFLTRHPELMVNIHSVAKRGVGGRRMLAVLDEKKLRRILSKLLDENHFLSPYGIRALSRWHLDHPYAVKVGDMEYEVRYLPAESDSGMFGGNSNWRGPIWMPVNAVLIRAILQYYRYYGDSFKVEMPTGSGHMMTLYEVAEELANRLVRIFTNDENGRRAFFGDAAPFQSDPDWHDNLLFYEYFHGDNGAGLGASHQTGWTGLVARMIQVFRTQTAESYLGLTDAEKMTESGSD